MHQMQVTSCSELRPPEFAGSPCVCMHYAMHDSCVRHYSAGLLACMQLTWIECY
jgi:hypothetical protein